MSDVLKMTVDVVSVGKTKEFGEKGFKKRELISTVTDGQYTNFFVFEFIQDKVDLLDGIFEGNEVTIFFNIRCRKVEREGKEDMYFTSLSGWKIEA